MEKIANRNLEVESAITLCICTMNRPDDLERCLKSVFQSTELPDEIIVSDDSSNAQPNQVVVAQFPTVIYQTGPRRGLGPNRNACIQKATGSHIIFIDDDVQVPPNFFALAKTAIAHSPTQTLITGYEMNHSKGEARKVVAHNPDFWGFQQVPVQDRCQAIVINATIFPCVLFAEAQFDERLRYGYEELDIARHAVALGYQICFQANLYVDHYPSTINREHYQQFVEASRLYTTTKAYWHYEQNWLKAIAFILLAPFQLLGGYLRRGNFAGAFSVARSTHLAFTYLLK